MKYLRSIFGIVTLLVLAACAQSSKIVTQQVFEPVNTVRDRTAYDLARYDGGVYAVGAKFYSGRYNPHGFYDGYLRNYKDDSTLLWSKSINSSSSKADYATAVVGLSLDDHYMAGYTDGVLPGQTDKSGRDAFLLRRYQYGWGSAEWL